MEGTRVAGRQPFMPASRILEGRPPEQHPRRQTTTRNAAGAGYQGRSPCLVREPERHATNAKTKPKKCEAPTPIECLAKTYEIQMLLTVNGSKPQAEIHVFSDDTITPEIVAK